jgi:hypothetical protein
MPSSMPDRQGLCDGPGGEKYLRIVCYFLVAKDYRAPDNKRFKIMDTGPLRRRFADAIHEENTWDPYCMA